MTYRPNINRPVMPESVLVRYIRHRLLGFVITKAKHKSRKFQNLDQLIFYCIVLYIITARNFVYN